ncbi:MAG: ABC transporter permease [Magnetococcales bacterium]|nr:ABC transporter permease [Magnetococcales bacterium]MBF0115917.1 ABC transporter permease [Magnetococcales bacterium]
MIRPIRALAQRELVRFFRQPHRVVGSLAQPLLFWLFLGSGFSASFRPPGLSGISYLEYFYPGILLMLLLFSGIFSTITLIEDRSQGLLQGVLVAPLPRMAIVLGKVGGAMGVALLQVVVLLLAIPWLGLHLGLGEALLLLFGLLLATLGFTTLGFLIAWNMESTAGFHAIMSIFLMPLWLLSGALFPMEHTPGWLQVLMQINPVTHALRLIRLPFYQSAPQLLTLPEYQLSLLVTVLWAVVCLAAALWQVKRIERGVPLS